MAVERAKAESKGLIFSNREDNMYAKQRGGRLRVKTLYKL